MIIKKIKQYTSPILILLLVVMGGYLRFTNLNYSEFQDDEKKALIRKVQNQSTYDFFMTRRKGPMQFLVTSITTTATKEPKNELLLRIPFTLANTFSIVVFYLILKKLFDSDLTAFFGSFLFLSNGFIVGFSRIAQYQNLNILFGLLAVYFSIILSKTKIHHLRNSLLSVMFFSLSLLSHWDAIFYLVPIIYFYFLYLRQRNTSKKDKKRLLLLNFALACVLLLPFLIPYIFNQFQNSSNIEYLNRRIGFDGKSLEDHLFIFTLYNPFVTIYALLSLAYIGLFQKKNRMLILMWFAINFVLIKQFMNKPGTHIYNYVIPLIVLATSGVHLLQKRKNLLAPTLLPIFILLGFLYFQSFKIFADNKQEYPWDGKEILLYKNIDFSIPEYKEKEILTFGFPHFRNLKYINTLLLNDKDNCTHISNEGKEITQFYIDAKYGITDDRKCYYIIYVKRPFNTSGKKVVFAKTKGKKPIYEYKKNGEVLTKVYKIYNKKYNK